MVRLFWGVILVNRKTMLCGLAAASLMLPACATITRGTSQKFNIDTTPTAADVKLSTGQSCVSPCKLKLKRKDGFTVTATKSGFENATAEVKSEVRGGGIAGAAGNVLIGGVIGGIVDGSSGAMKDLTPNPLHLTLKPVSPPAVVAESVEPQAAPVADAAPAAAAIDGAVPTADAATPVPSTEVAPVAQATSAPSAE